MPEQPSEEQMAALQEKIKNMSPEELKEFQKKQCIFCQIIEGKVQSKKIFEDNIAYAILDINPANPGHILLLPKEHYTIMPQVPEDELNHIFMLAKSLSNALLRGIGAQGTNIIVANGVAAGQRAQHFMVHIIPRMDKDGLQFTVPQNEIPEAELNEIAEKLANTLGSVDAEVSQAEAAPIPKEKQVVEGDFEEEKGEEDTEEETTEKPDEKGADEEKPSSDEEVSLEDVAGLLGGKSQEVKEDESEDSENDEDEEKEEEDSQVEEKPENDEVDDDSEEDEPEETGDEEIDKPEDDEISVQEEEKDEESSEKEDTEEPQEQEINDDETDEDIEEPEDQDEEKPEQNNDQVNLDDISRLFGGR